MLGYDRYNPFRKPVIQQPHVGYVKRVVPVSFSSGTKFHVTLRDGAEFYTWDTLHGQLLASVCQAGHDTIRGVKVWSKKTFTGHQIVEVEFVPEPQGEVA